MTPPAVATFCLDLLASALVTATQPGGLTGSTVSGPDAVDCLRGLAAWLLVAGTWTAAGALAGALGAPPMGRVNGAPGVNTLIGGLAATGLLVVYLTGFLALTFAQYDRRDIAE